MQNEIEHNRRILHALNRRLAELDAERNRIQQTLQALDLPPANRKSANLWGRTTLTGASFLVVAALLYDSFIHDARSSIKTGEQPQSFATTLKILQSEQDKHTSAASNTAPNRLSTFSRTKAASERQWGPLLVMPKQADKQRSYAFDKVVKAQQKNLLTLGFDVGDADGFKGPGTQRAIAEFRALYLPDSAAELEDTELAVIMDSYASLARRDAARYGIDHGVVAAIRLSSVRTGVDFSYLMKLAATESNFEPRAEAATSSATGLYQFTHDTWLHTLKTHGGRYGLVADYVANIEYYESRSGQPRPRVKDQAIYRHLLELRKNPRLAAIMVAETVREHQQQLAKALKREPTETDFYLAHFLGIDSAITFLQSLQQRPDMHAVELFPRAASSNHDIFHPSSCEPRTVDEVYALFDEKFSTRRYDDLGYDELDDDMLATN